MSTLLPTHYIAGGVYAKEWQGKAGERIEQHEHVYDHLSYLAYGKVLVTVDGKGTVFDGPVGINIRAHKQHTVQALSNCLWLCIHAIPDDLQDSTMIENALISSN